MGKHTLFDKNAVSLHPKRKTPWVPAGTSHYTTTHSPMDYLPNDPAILVSSINMLLRDEEYDTLESLCNAFSRDPQEIKDYLLAEGYVWSEQQKQFRPKGFDA